MADNQIERILPLLNLPAHQVLPKSMEIERMMRLKVPNGILKKVQKSNEIFHYPFLIFIREKFVVR
jgi:hypothetical protein